MRYFHRNVTGDEAEELLKEHGKEGSFLFRNSTSSHGEYSITVKYHNRIWHIKIQKNDDFFCIGCIKFASLTEIITYFYEYGHAIQEKSGSYIYLKYPMECKSDEAYQVILKEKWFHVGIDGSESERLLKERGVPGMYLVRESSSRPGGYVLCVLMHDQTVTQVVIYPSDSGEFHLGGGMHFRTVAKLIEFYSKTPMVENTNGSIITLEKPLFTHRGDISHLGHWIKCLERTVKTNSGAERTGCAIEFEELNLQCNSNLKRSGDVGSREENISKNRYTNIFPFDKTRVKLTIDCGGCGDYINANYIRELKENYDIDDVSPATYIATQGIMNNTIVDFWRMILQEDVDVIVMLNKEQENKRRKCVRYFPTSSNIPQNSFVSPPPPSQLFETSSLISNSFSEISQVYDTPQLLPYSIHVDPGSNVMFFSEPSIFELTVEFVQEEICESFIQRNFNVSLNTNSTSLKREVRHFQFTRWPDHGVPNDPAPLICFIQAINRTKRELKSQSPIVVHCSAGIGRTGTYIALDLIMRRLSASNFNMEIDVFTVVQRLREQRSGMVQTEHQYLFIYKCLCLYYETRKAREDYSMNAVHEYQNTNCSGYSNISSSSSTLAAQLLSTSPAEVEVTPPPIPPKIIR